MKAVQEPSEHVKILLVQIQQGDGTETESAAKFHERFEFACEPRAIDT
jgi:hypothetical protein